MLLETNRSFLVAICSIGFLASCNLRPVMPELIPEVNIVTVGQQSVPVFTDYVGTTFGQSDVDIQARIDGLVTGVHFTEGSFVKQGQLLYTIDDAPQRNKVDGAAARVAQANTQMVRTKADLDRVRPLTEMHALSQRELEAATAAYNASVNEVEIAKSALENAKVELSYSRITAPISGIIGISKVQVGDYVSRIATSGSLNTISSVGDVRVRFSISEDEYLRFARLRKASPAKSLTGSVHVQLILSDGSLYDQEGEVNIANRQIDPSTGSLLLQANFKNPSTLLRPGQYVKVRVKTDTYENAVIVPQQAINQMQNIYQVYVLNDSNQLAPRTIKTGTRSGSNWIVTEGLQPGEKIAVVGNAMLKPGMPIKPLAMNWNYDSTSAK